MKKNKNVLLLILVIACFLFIGINSNIVYAIEKDESQTEETTTTDESVEETFAVNYNSNGGSSVTSQSVIKGTNTTAPARPTKENYVFVGWYSDSGLTHEFDFNTNITADITLYAKWVGFTSLPYTKIINNETYEILIPYNLSDEEALSYIQKNISDPEDGFTVIYSQIDESNYYVYYYEDNSWTKGNQSLDRLVGRSADVYAIGTTKTIPRRTLKNPLSLTVSDDVTADIALTLVSLQTLTEIEEREIYAYNSTTNKYSYIVYNNDWDPINNPSVPIFMTNADAGLDDLSFNEIISDTSHIYSIFGSYEALTITNQPTKENPTVISSSNEVTYQWGKLNVETTDFDESMIDIDNSTYDTFMNGEMSFEEFAILAFKTDGIITEESELIFTTDGEIEDLYEIYYDGIFGELTKTGTNQYSYKFKNYLDMYVIAVGPIEEGGATKIINPKIVNTTVTPLTSNDFKTNTLDFSKLTLPGDYVCEITSLINSKAKVISNAVNYTKSYTVTFNTNGGSTITSQNVTNGSKVSAPTDPTREGYVFKGWYKEDTFTNKWNFTTNVVLENTTLYAKWEKVSSSYTYDIISGDNKNFNKGEADSYEIRIDGDYSKFESFKINGITLVKDTDYTITEGSTIITFTAVGLNKIKTLAAGDYTFTVKYNNDKTVNGTLKVTETSTDDSNSNTNNNTDSNTNITNNPQTSDNIISYIISLIFGIVCLAGGIIYLNRKRLFANR